MTEPTEMGEAPKAETEAIYARALDDGVHDLPTHRLTSRRITALSLVASRLNTRFDGEYAAKT